MNLHVFTDTLGVYSGYASERIHRLNPKNNVIINLADHVNKPNEKIQIIGKSKDAWEHFLSGKKFDKIIFHPYTYLCSIFLAQYLKKNQKPEIHWCCWSAELYTQNNFYIRLLEPFSAKFYREQKGVVQKVKDLIKKFTLNKWRSVRLHRSYLQIDYFHALQRGDYDFLISLSSCASHIKYERFNYLSIEEVFPGKHSTMYSTGDIIQVGHSSGIGGNHFEILSLLHEMNISQTIKLPMAYGDERYKKRLMDAIKNYHLNIDVEEQKVSTDVYYNNLCKVGYAIFNVKVQQGLGNLIALMWLGVKVFLREESSVYQDFARRGFHIYSTNELFSQRNVGPKLNREEVEHNRQLLFSLLSTARVDQYWASLVGE